MLKRLRNRQDSTIPVPFLLHFPATQDAVVVCNHFEHDLHLKGVDVHLTTPDLPLLESGVE